MFKKKVISIKKAIKSDCFFVLFLLLKYLSTIKCWHLFTWVFVVDSLYLK